MPRRKVVEKREIFPDPKHNSVMAAKFVNNLMVDGKKSVAERIFYDTLEIMEERTKQDPMKLFKKAVDNAKPLLEVKSRRVGGATYQVPVEVSPERRQALSFRWLIQYAKARSEQSMAERLASEVIDAANNRGATIKKREDTHKMAEANKAFAHYRW
jgi:small subunit ribosomal protein S7